MGKVMMVTVATWSSDAECTGDKGFEDLVVPSERLKGTKLLDLASVVHRRSAEHATPIRS